MTEGFEMSNHYMAVPPGSTIRSQMMQNNLTPHQLATHLQISETALQKLLCGNLELTSALARRLEQVLFLPVSFWSGMESDYRETLQKVREENRLTDTQNAKIILQP